MIHRTLSEQISRKAEEKQRTYKTMRWGQALFNSLADLNSNLADQITGTTSDPFYDDEKVGAFFAVIHFYEVGYKVGFDDGLKNSIY